MGNGSFEVRRFYCGIHQNGFVGLIPDEKGGVVMLEDYAKLEAQVKQLAAENAALKSKAAELVHEASEVYSAYNAAITEPDGDFMDMQTLQEMQCVETTATDAFLSRLRAEGVEMFAVFCRKKAEVRAYNFFSDAALNAEEFASQLREGKAGEVCSE